MDPHIQVSQSLTVIVFTVSGTDGKTWEVIVDDSWHKTGSGNSTFTTSLFGVGSHTAILFIADFQVASAIFIETEVVYPPEPPTPPTPPPPPTPDPSGAVEAARVGTSCTIMGQGSNGVYFYAIKHDRNGYLTNYHRDDLGDVIREAERIPACNETPPPPPPTVEELIPRVSGLEQTVSAIQSSLIGINSTISEIISAAEEEAASWRAGLETAISGLRDSLTAALDSAVNAITTRIDNINELLDETYYQLIPEIWGNLNEIAVSAEEEATAWRQGVLDLDASLKAWISSGIIDIVWDAITRDEEED